MTKRHPSQYVTRHRKGSRRLITISDEGKELVKAMAAEGNDGRSISAELGLPYSTYMDWVKRDSEMTEILEIGHASLADELTHMLLEKARKGNVVAMIYLTKSRCNWSENNGPDTKNEVNVNISIPAPMSDDEFTKIIDGTIERGRDLEDEE